MYNSLDMNVFASTYEINEHTVCKYDAIFGWARTKPTSKPRGRETKKNMKKAAFVHPYHGAV